MRTLEACLIVLLALLNPLTNHAQIHELDCESEVYSIPRHHPRLSKRYIYYPDHLVLLPSTLSLNPFMLLKLFWQCLTEPVFADALRVAWNMDKNHAENLLFDHTKGRQAPRSLSLSSLQDMSMGDLFAARTGSTTIVDNLASALIHGIWGGDIWKLSAMEGTFQAAFLQYHLRLSPTDGKKVLTKESDYFSGSDIITRTPEIARLVDKYADSGYLGFTHGFSALPNKLAKKLEQNPNVTIKKGTHVTALKYNKNAKQAVIHTSQQEKNRHDKVISSLYSGTLGKLAGDLLPTLKEDSAAVSIQIVNIWYENVRLDEKYPGFGYLIPQSVPAENNPCAALGVIFDSDRDAAAGGLDTRPNRGTNLTVMLGGHYWDFVTPDKWPSKDLVVDMAKETVHRHLGIPAHEATYVSTKLCRHCIPQHLVGHRDRMAQAHKEISDAFGETLAVVGGSYTMPGVLPSLQAARDVALAVAGGEYQIDLDIRSDISVGYAMKHVGKTGLGRFVGNNNETFRLVDDRQIPFRSRDHTQFNDPIFQQ